MSKAKKRYYIISYTWQSFQGRKTSTERHYKKEKAEEAIRHLKELAKERPNAIQDINIEVVEES